MGVGRFLVLLLVSLVAPLVAQADARADHAASRIAQNASCVGCHSDIAVEWTRSMHRQSWRDPVFQKAYAIEPVAFCRGCHAPESDPAFEPTPPAQAIGIGCVSCHVDDGDGVHASARSGRAQHEVVVDAGLATRAVCAKCHQFDFPAEARLSQRMPMQDTAEEHANGSKATTACQSCHMPIVEGTDGKHRSHSFEVLADPAILRRAVDVRAERTEHAVVVHLQAAAIGHAFPTGDMFRRVEVRVSAHDGNGRVVARAESVVLQRRFEDRARDPLGGGLGFVRMEVEDRRVPAPGGGERIATLALPDTTRGLRVKYSVVYQRMSTPMAEAFGVSQVLDEVLIASGELAPSVLVSTLGGAR